MNLAIGIISALAIYGVIGFCAYLILRKVSKYLKKRIFLPNDDLTLYLQPIDTQSEEKIRKQWLTTFIISTLFSIVCVIPILMDPQIAAQISFSSAPALYSIIFAVGGVVSILIIWAVYHCAYKKRGTAILLLILISIPFGQIQFYMTNILKPYNYSNLTMTLILISSVIQFLYWITSLRLRNANLKRRYHATTLHLQEKFKQV
jgi:hypothetical protein